MTGLPDDPSDRPTRMNEFGADGWQQVLDVEPENSPDAVEPAPWYRNRVLLGLWALMAALLLALIIYGIVELSRGGGTSIPSTSTSTTTPSRSSTTSPTTTAPSTTTETPPPSETSEQPPDAPPPANNSPSPATPPRHHHHFHLPHLF